MPSMMPGADVPPIAHVPMAHLMMELHQPHKLGPKPHVAGFTVRTFRVGSDDDRINWADIEVAAGEFGPPNRPDAGDLNEQMASALAHFDEEFGKYPDELAARCFFIQEDSSCQAVGTCSAWCVAISADLPHDTSDF